MSSTKGASNAAAALAIELTSDDLHEIDGALSKIVVKGTRLPEEHLKLIDR